VFRVLILAVCVVRVPFPEIDAALIPIRPLWHPAVLLTGNALLAGSFAWVIYTHFYMAEHWKSGTPPGNGSRLITSGPFGRSRNPMLLGVQIAQLGLFLSLPSAFTLVCLAVGLWAVHAQVRVEERLLAERWGDAYTAYRAHTPRWL
jgi:protein-S-isoprenylcysteine O-methyltransferase Ste14